MLLVAQTRIVFRKGSEEGRVLGESEGWSMECEVLRSPGSCSTSQLPSPSTYLASSESAIECFPKNLVCIHR